LDELEKVVENLSNEKPAAAAAAAPSKPSTTTEDDDEVAALERQLAALEGDDVDLDELEKVVAKLADGDRAATPTVAGTATTNGGGDDDDDELSELQRKLDALDSGDIDLEELERVAGELGIDPSELEQYK
jgi:vacuolar-type H+-ATPase subunit I/STV1